MKVDHQNSTDYLDTMSKSSRYYDDDPVTRPRNTLFGTLPYETVDLSIVLIMLSWVFYRIMRLRRKVKLARNFYLELAKKNVDLDKRSEQHYKAAAIHASTLTSVLSQSADADNTTDSSKENEAIDKLHQSVQSQMDLMQNVLRHMMEDVYWVEEDA